jgi:hypothetical protein
MRRWAIITVALYALVLLLLTIPVSLVAWLKWSAASGWIIAGDLSPGEVMKIFAEWGYWLWLGVLVTAQALLLLVPVAAAERRPVRRRPLLVPVIVAGFLLANLFLAGVFVVLSAAMGDNASKVVEVPAGMTEQAISSFPGLAGKLAGLGLTPGSDWFSFLHLMGLLLLFWLVWGLVFYHVTRHDESESFTQRLTRWLLRGSILELLVAVPSHIIVRHRGDCCAPFATFWGIVTGISVMLLSFGPGVLFLFAARIRQRQPRTAPPRI